MEPKISATVLVIFVLLGVSANTAIYAQAQPTIITPHSSSTVEPISSPTNAMIDLNNPVSLDTNANVNTEISSNTTAFSTTLNDPTLINPCLNGVVIYQTSLITNQPVPICVTSDMINSQFLTTWGQLFNIDFTVKSDSNNNNHDNNNHNDKDHDNNNNSPDRDCLFKPSLDKCASDHGKCPDGFFQNEGEHCVPKHDHGCPPGNHSVDDDESGQCIKNKKGCPDGMEFRSDGKSCTYKQNEPKQPEQPIPLVDLSKEPVNPAIPLVDINQDPTTTTTDTTTPPITTTTDQPINTDQSSQQPNQDTSNNNDGSNDNTNTDTESSNSNSDSGSSGSSDSGSSDSGSSDSGSSDSGSSDSGSSDSSGGSGSDSGGGSDSGSSGGDSGGGSDSSNN